jgi:hypothetical protein
MNYTINSSNNQIVITSDLISAYIDIISTVPPGVPGYTLTLTIKYNDLLAVNIVLSPTNVSVNTDSFILTPTMIGQGSTFEEGIYSIQLVKSNDNAKESLCIPLLLTLQCRVMEYTANLIKEKKEPDYILLLLELLKQSNDCADCNCDEAFAIYNHILSVLNTTTILEDCGCTD